LLTWRGVDVDHYAGDAAAVAHGPPALLIQDVIEIAAVKEAREVVVEHQAMQFVGAAPAVVRAVDDPAEQPDENRTRRDERYGVQNEPDLEGVQVEPLTQQGQRAEQHWTQDGNRHHLANNSASDRRTCHARHCASLGPCAEEGCGQEGEGRGCVDGHVGIGAEVGLRGGAEGVHEQHRESD
jgi:hypothetical protein